LASVTASLIISANDRTRPILSGAVKPERADLTVTEGNPSDIFWRQLHAAEFDISEMSLSSYMRLIDRGDRTWVGLPVFPYGRHFFHTWFLVRRDAGIEAPADLKEKRIGVPEYQITSAVWSRGVLQEEFGVRPEDIIWYMGRTREYSHGTAMGSGVPAGIRCEHLPKDKEMAQMLLDGELDGIAIYFRQRTIVDRSQIDLHAHPAVKTLFPDPVAEGIRYYNKTNIHPINHCVVVRRTLAERHPWLVMDICRMFEKAKAFSYAQNTEKAEALRRTGRLSAEACEAMSADPFPYGLKENRHIIEKLAQYVHEQGLTSRRISVEEIFDPSMLDL